MTASALGVLTATPSTGVPCDGPEFPGLWVALLDRSGNVVALNQYVFHVADATK